MAGDASPPGASASTSTTGVVAGRNAATPTRALLAAGRATRAARAVLRSPARGGPGLPSPVHAHRLSHFLKGFDNMLRDALVNGFTHGFRIPSTIHNSTAGTYRNHQSAITHPLFVNSKIDREIAMVRLAGPFAVPTPANVIVSPLGVVPKKVPGEYRLIHDLSLPKFDSVNSYINKFYTEVSYELLDHCIGII